MRKVWMLLVVILLICIGYILYNMGFFNFNTRLNVEEEIVNIDTLYIYGTHLNMHGDIINDDNLDLVLYDGKFLDYEINTKDGYFNLSEYINDGIYLENIPLGKYSIFIRSKSTGEDGKDVFRYYAINNNSGYDETVYYTFDDIGNKIVISNSSDYNTLGLTVSRNKDIDAYDIVLDAGHGGVDSGTIKNGYYESDMTMKIVTNLKNKLINEGYKVKLTRDVNDIASDKTMDNYGENGRAVIPHNVKAKYIFSIHMNSSYDIGVNGLEIYTANNIDYTFAKKLANNLVADTGIKYSNDKINKISDGVYTRMFTNDDITKSKTENNNKGYKAYDITTNSVYYYMIRETGGIMTGAYVDNRNEEVMGNPYYNTNVGVEAYLLELGYLSNKNDLNNINNNLDKYTDSIVKSFNNLINSN